MQLQIGVYTRGGDLRQHLESCCPERTFVDGDAPSGASVVIVDSDSQEALARASAASCRIVLTERPIDFPRHSGDVRVMRQAFLESPAEYLAVADDVAANALHVSQLEQEVGYLTQIHELTSMTEPEAVSERVTRTVLNLLGVARGTLLLHDPRLERYAVSFSNDPDYRETGEFLPGVPPDLLQRSLSSGNLIAADEEAGLIVMPLRVEDDLIGVIRVVITEGESFDERTIAAIGRYLRAVVQVLGNIYQLTRSRDLAMRDDLTKAYNRRFFDSYLDEEMGRSRRYGTLFSIIFLDLDDLKMVNNVYGHLTGSRTLQEVAKRILGAVRAIDKVVRFGGDEFCIILPQTDEEQAIAVANRIKKSLISSPIKVEPDIEVMTTASFGIAAYPTHALTKEDLIRQADQAMYRVKSTTKNAVGVATVEDATKPAAM